MPWDETCVNMIHRQALLMLVIAEIISSYLQVTSFPLVN